MFFIHHFFHSHVTTNEVSYIVQKCVWFGYSCHFRTKAMDKGSPAQIQTQSKRIKRTVTGLHVDLPLQAEGSVELSDQSSRSEIAEDREVQEEAAEFPQQQKRRSRNKPHGGRSHGKGDIPKTFITAVLEELNDDVIGEPTRLDTGKEGFMVEWPKTRSKFFNPFADT
jgi:hypothetical protein